MERTEVWGVVFVVVMPRGGGLRRAVSRGSPTRKQHHPKCHLTHKVLEGTFQSKAKLSAPRCHRNPCLGGNGANPKIGERVLAAPDLSGAGYSRAGQSRQREAEQGRSPAWRAC